MMKAHCDNCDAVIVDAEPERRLTVQPCGYQCEVALIIRKQAGPSKLGAEQVLCADCLHAAAIAFAESLSPALTRRTTTSGTVLGGSGYRTALDVVGTEGGKASVETKR